MKEIRLAAAAYYENLPEEKKRYAIYIFSEIDKDGDWEINLYGYVDKFDKKI